MGFRPFGADRLVQTVAPCVGIFQYVQWYCFVSVPLRIIDKRHTRALCNTSKGGQKLLLPEAVRVREEYEGMNRSCGCMRASTVLSRFLYRCRDSYLPSNNLSACVATTPLLRSTSLSRSTPLLRSTPNCLLDHPWGRRRARWPRMFPTRRATRVRRTRVRAT